MCKHAGRWFLATVLVWVGYAAQAATIDKTNNVDNLNLTTSWKGGVMPKVNDVARWGSFVAGPNASGLSAVQLQSLRLNGERVWFQLDAQGYLWKMTGTLLRLR
jgi:hypothetical protein